MSLINWVLSVFRRHLLPFLAIFITITVMLSQATAFSKTINRHGGVLRRKAVSRQEYHNVHGGQGIASSVLKHRIRKRNGRLSALHLVPDVLDDLSPHERNRKRSTYNERQLKSCSFGRIPLRPWTVRSQYRSHSRLWASLSTIAKPQTAVDDDENHNSEWDVSSKPTCFDYANEHSSEEGLGRASAEQRLADLGLRSRPVEGGNWNVEDPLGWSKGFGGRSPAYQEKLDGITRLRPGDEGYFDVDFIKVPKVTMVRSVEDAKIVLDKLMAADPSVFHACDTEVMDIDLNAVGPVGNGYVTCVSIYSGPDFDYGLGDAPGSRLWIDNLDDAHGVLQVFKPWFQDKRFLKVWHNYGFDRHVMWNEGIDCQGFGGDTMHMARLLDTSLSKLGSGGNGYSLEALSAQFLSRKKKPMKEIFGIKRLRKDGSEGSLVDIPAVEVLQRDPKHRPEWIEYSCYDAESTWLLRERFEGGLKLKSWFENNSLYEYYFMHMRPFGEVLTDMERRGIRVDAHDYLAKVEEQAREDRAKHSKAFRDWAATKIGPDGLAINTASSLQLATLLFGGAENQKTKIATELERDFKVPREELLPDALEALEAREAKPSQEAQEPESVLDHLDKMKVAQLKTLCKEYGLKVSGKKAELQERIREHFEEQAKIQSQPKDDIDSMSEEDIRHALMARGVPSMGTRDELVERLRQDEIYLKQLVDKDPPSDPDDFAKLTGVLEDASRKGALSEYMKQVKEDEAKPAKHFDVKIKSLQLKPEKYTAGGAPSVTADVIKKLAGDPFADPPKYGSAFDQLGKEGCEALFSLGAIGSIDTMIANFLTSLQELADDTSRVHCSLNLNTETGRLSSRRPNLQNQPALEKDKYKIRKAFQASPGNNLIVADYGQLELRILASITGCKSMIDAFASGGDFHSRTAVDMFDYVKEALDNGDCLLEWDYSKGDPPKPLLKDVYASERRKAKTLNFSIAYGKTAHGLSQDWGVKKEEAEKMLQAWYAARKEVDAWQKQTKEHANFYGETRTLMGRYRQIPGAKSNDRKLKGHGERAAINTPIQGGAADIAMIAMNKINASEKLKALGWILLLQIHDEVILEGPEETAEEAFEEVLKCMQEPWVFGLKPTAVPLLVDGSCTHKTWYDAK